SDRIRVVSSVAVLGRSQRYSYSSKTNLGQNKNIPKALMSGGQVSGNYAWIESNGFPNCNYLPSSTLCDCTLLNDPVPFQNWTTFCPSLADRLVLMGKFTAIRLYLLWFVTVVYIVLLLLSCSGSV